MTELLQKASQLDWEENKKFLQKSRFRPMHDRAFGRIFRQEMSECFVLGEDIKPIFLKKFDEWIHNSKINVVQGLDQFPHRDFISGVTHSLDDLHIVFGDRLVCIEKEYAYHKRMKPDFPHKTLENLRSGDVLVFAIPFAWYGSEHPRTLEILDHCLNNQIPVHVDAAYFGCLRDFNFDFSHPAIKTVSFSLSKGLGMGSNRVGVRYSRERHPGPVTIINDFSMEVTSVMKAAIKMMDHFGSDYLQTRYGEAYNLICEKLSLKKTKTIHVAFYEESPEVWIPVGIRSFLRYLVDDLNEFK